VVRIGTRGSRLARAQAEWVGAALEARWPEVRGELVTIVTAGDRLAGSLSRHGGKGLFVTEIEEALLHGRVDCAVHSMKDMPVAILPGLTIAAVPVRADPRDVMVGPPDCRGLEGLPTGARVGTASLRRRAQLLAARPDLSVLELRGNVDTRLRKRADGIFDAVVVAAAGLARLGLGDGGGTPLDPATFLPAVGQGALALEARESDLEMQRMLLALDDEETRQRVTAERAFLRGLGGDCATPIAAHSELDGRTLALAGLVALPDGTRVLKDGARGPSASPDALGSEVAERLKIQGAERLLALVRGDRP
jgi:hydroxymethylbilane synthase